jgi:hypothetical protein
MRRWLMSTCFVCLVTGYGLAQSVLSILPGFSKLAHPRIADVEFATAETIWTFRFQSYAVEAKTNSNDAFDPATVTFTDRAGRRREFSLSYGLLEPYFGTVVSFDADQNGLDDLFITSSMVGTSGIGAHAPRIAAFFFYPDSVIRLVELSSFLGDLDLFRDFNGDGKFEFACIKYLGGIDGGPTNSYYAVNLFALRDTQFVNISLSTPGYPVVLQQLQSGMRVVKAVPEIYKRNVVLGVPDVWGSL